MLQQSKPLSRGGNVAIEGEQLVTQNKYASIIVITCSPIIQIQAIQLIHKAYVIFETNKSTLRI